MRVEVTLAPRVDPPETLWEALDLIDAIEKRMPGTVWIAYSGEGDTRPSRRQRLVDWVNSRTDHPPAKRVEMLAKIEATTDAALKAERGCVGKHWWVMEPGDTCGYCGWTMKRR